MGVGLRGIGLKAVVEGAQLVGKGISRGLGREIGRQERARGLQPLRRKHLAPPSDEF